MMVPTIAVALDNTHASLAESLRHTLGRRDAWKVAVGLDRTGNPLVEDLLSKALEVTDGTIEVPQEPGLGVELNEGAIADHAVPQGIPALPGNCSDMVFV